jgi:hypothetical protein
LEVALLYLPPSQSFFLLLSTPRPPFPKSPPHLPPSRPLPSAILSSSGPFLRPLYCDSLLVVKIFLLAITSLVEFSSIAFSVAAASFLFRRCQTNAGLYFRLAHSSTEVTSCETQQTHTELREPESCTTENHANEHLDAFACTHASPSSVHIAST